MGAEGLKTQDPSGEIVSSFGPASHCATPPSWTPRTVAAAIWTPCACGANHCARRVSVTLN